MNGMTNEQVQAILRWREARDKKRNMLIVISIIAFIAGLLSTALFIHFIVKHEESPADVVKKWDTCLLRGDTAEAYSLLTVKSKSVIPYSDFVDIYRDSLYDGATVVNSTISGNTAQVTIKFKKGHTGTMVLEKEDGKWKIAVDKYQSSSTYY